MARGATKTAEQMSQGQVANANQALGTAQSQAGQAYGQLMPQISQMLSPGGDPAVTAATMGALGSSFGNAKQGVMDTAARTNNAASTNAALDKLGLQEGTTAADTAAKNVASQHGEADKLLAQIYGQNTGLQPGLLNAGSQGVNDYTNAIKTGGGVLNSILGGLGAGVGSYFGAKK